MQNLHWLLIRASIPAKQVFMKLADTHNLTPMQLFTLCLVEKKREVTMQSISTTLGCDASNTTGIVERLVTGSFIERSECARDRRIKVVKLTQKGETIRTQIVKALDAVESPTLAGLTHQEITTLKRLLAKAIISCCPKSPSK